MNSQRIGSFVLLAGGILLVFAGVASALGFSWWGLVASGTAIVALLYAGGVWFGATAAPVARADLSVVLFTQALTVASGPLLGRRIADLWPAANRRAIEDGCRAALRGEWACFTSASQPFAISPVRTPDGAVIYGLLLSGAAAHLEHAVTRV
jgi:hypothetical protein